jgi:HlyD family secretion protein
MLAPMEPAASPVGASPRPPLFTHAPRRRAWWLVPIAALAVGFGAYRARAATPPPRYLTAAVSRGDLVASVRATGTVQPLQEVLIGAQASGRVVRVRVDYNSPVRAGDVLAEIDPATSRAQVAQGRAALSSARAQVALREAELALTERNLARAESLRARSLNAPSDLDASLAARDVARASVRAARAQAEQAAAALLVSETSLALTRVVSPIDGVVASRAVDPGQTVASSFQSPTLFVIDSDLSRMRVIANVDEANIGRLSEGLAANVAVDAFPRETFRGAVRSLRITPTTTNGVVTYQAVIEVENPQRRLRPGMTATVSVVTARRDATLRVPNAALRYRPQGAATGADRAIYVLSGSVAMRVPVRVGLSDDTSTEVSAPGLAEGARVVLDETDAAPGGQPSRQGPPRMF